MLENSLTLFFPFLMIYAAMSDLFSMTISNKVSLILIAGFMFFAVSVGMSWESIAWHWAMFGIVLLVGFTLFAFNVVGGGDAKLAASTALWFGWEHVLSYVYISSLLGAVLTLLIVFFRAQHLPLRVGNVEWIQRELLSNLVFEVCWSCGDLTGLRFFNSVFEPDACDDFWEVLEAS